MNGFTVPIAPGNSLRESGLSLAGAKAVLDGDTIVTESILDTVNGVQAALFAIKRTSDGQVFARLSEWTLEGHDKLHITFRDEPEAFPAYRTATLEVLSKLTPTVQPESLVWRDRSRWVLAQAGAFDLAQSIESPPVAATETNRAPELPASQGGALPPEDGAGRPSGAEQAPRQQAPVAKTSRLRLIVDRAPECRTGQASGSVFLKFSGYAIEGAKGFIKLIAFQPVAEPLAKNLGSAISATGAAMLSVDGRFETKGAQRQFKVSAVLAAEATQEQIPQHTKTDDAEGRDPNQPAGSSARQEQSL